MSSDVPLTVDSRALPDDARLLKSLVVELVATVRTRDERIAQLERNMDLLARKVFGRTSEKLDPRQTTLFGKRPVGPVVQFGFQRSGSRFRKASASRSAFSRGSWVKRLRR